MTVAKAGARAAGDQLQGRFDGPAFEVQLLRGELEALRDTHTRLPSEGARNERAQAIAAALQARVEQLSVAVDALTLQLAQRDVESRELKAAVEERRGFIEEVLRQLDNRAAAVRDELSEARSQLTAAREQGARLEADLHEASRERDRLRESNGRSYRHLKQRLLVAMHEVIPRNATALMISRGDDELVAIAGRKVWHFPQTPEGFWAGQYPADGAAAIAHLEMLRTKGASFLVLPDTARWWLEHYHDLRTHLRRYRVVFDREDTGLIVDVTPPSWQRRLCAAMSAFEKRAGRAPAVLDWDSRLQLAEVLPHHAVFSPPVFAPALPYLDRSVDIVVCPKRSALAAEAHRVASGLVVTVSRSTSNGGEPASAREEKIRVGIEPVARAAAPSASRGAKVGSSQPAPFTRRRLRSRRGTR